MTLICERYSGGFTNRLISCIQFRRGPNVLALLFSCDLSCKTSNQRRSQMRKLTVLFWALILTAPSAELMKIQAAEDKFAYTHRPPNGNADIYVVDGKGGEPIQLTDDLAWDSWPAWSPDGTLLAFLSDLRLVVMDANGKNRICCQYRLAGLVSRWTSTCRNEGVLHLDLRFRDTRTRVGCFGLQTVCRLPSVLTSFMKETGIFTSLI